jgi:hypothetical protein
MYQGTQIIDGRIGLSQIVHMLPLQLAHIHILALRVLFYPIELEITFGWLAGHMAFTFGWTVLLEVFLIMARKSMVRAYTITNSTCIPDIGIPFISQFMIACLLDFYGWH